jgi:hypothetical protein
MNSQRDEPKISDGEKSGKLVMLKVKIVFEIGDVLNKRKRNHSQTRF